VEAPGDDRTCQVALLVKALLEQHGITVVLTRTTDTGVGPCADQRAAIGNQAHANAAVSIQADGNDGGHSYQILQAQQSGAVNDARSPTWPSPVAAAPAGRPAP
jgi:N-acetylmuramoyl-L-alanine amidase